MESKNGDPLQKAYRIDSNFKMVKTAKRCPGHGTRQHGHIEGDETAKTTVYTKKMSKAIVADITIFSRKFTPSSMLLSNPVTEDFVNICTVHKSGNQQVTLLAQRM